MPPLGAANGSLGRQRKTGYATSRAAYRRGSSARLWSTRLIRSRSSCRCVPRRSLSDAVMQLRVQNSLPRVAWFVDVSAHHTWPCLYLAALEHAHPRRPFQPYDTDSADSDCVASHVAPSAPPSLPARPTHPATTALSTASKLLCASLATFHCTRCALPGIAEWSTEFDTTESQLDTAEPSRYGGVCMLSASQPATDKQTE